MSRVTRRHPFRSLQQQGVGESATTFPGLLHFTLDPYLIMLSVKQGGIKYHFLSLWYYSTCDWTQVSRAIGEHSNHHAKIYMWEGFSDFRPNQNWYEIVLLCVSVCGEGYLSGIPLSLIWHDVILLRVGNVNRDSCVAVTKKPSTLLLLDKLTDASEGWKYIRVCIYA